MQPYEIEHVNLEEQKIPDDYHCDCDFCKKFAGVLIRKDGTKYSKLERRKYYNTEVEKAHIAKTPLHVARWAIQEYSEIGEMVLDPTMGAGTTAVEALMQERDTAGIEIEFKHVIDANIEKCNPYNYRHFIAEGDARDLLDIFPDLKVDLVVNNPPYSGDVNQKYYGKAEKNEYDKRLSKNLALMKENQEYWETLGSIYGQAKMLLKKGGRLVIGVKDMIRQKAPFLIHKFYGEQILEQGYTFERMVLLPHYPPTMFMSTYNKRFPDVPVPRYQTILVFRND